jgi:hypothetical protein
MMPLSPLFLAAHFWLFSPHLIFTYLQDIYIRGEERGHYHWMAVKGVVIKVKRQPLSITV